MQLVLILTLFAIYYFGGAGRSVFDQKTRRKQVTLMGSVMFLFAALRSFDVGQDLPMYYDQYLRDAHLQIDDILVDLASRDPVFHIFIHFLNYISPNPQLMLVVVAFVVTFGFSYLVYHEKGNVLLFFMMFIGFRMFSFTLSGLRQAIALGLIFIAYVYLKKSKYIPYIVITLLASLFHTTAILFLLAFPASKVNYKVLSITLISAALAIVLSGGGVSKTIASLIFDERFEGYSLTKFEGNTTFYLYLIMYAISLSGMRNIIKHDNNAVIAMNMFTIGIFFSFIGQQLDSVFRIAYYFIFAQFPVFSVFIYNQIKGEHIMAEFVHFIICVLLVAQYLLLGTGAGTDNYTFFWESSFMLR